MNFHPLISILILTASAWFISACAAPATTAPAATSAAQSIATIAPSATNVPTVTKVPPTQTSTVPTLVVLPTLVIVPTLTSVSPTQTIVNSPPNQSATSVPLLYTDIVEKDGKKRAVTKAIDENGKNLGIAAESFGAAWSPDGTTFLYVNLDGTELVQQNLGAQGKTILRAKSDERFRRLPIWSPDGKRIALITRTPEGDDGKQVIVIENAQEVARYDLPPLAEEHIWNPNKFRWSPDSKKILLSWDYTIVVDTETKEIETISDQRVLAEWSPTSNAIYFFDLVTPGIPYGDLGAFNLKKLGDSNPIVLMKAEQVSALGLHTNLSAFAVRIENLQFCKPSAIHSTAWR